jgi:hypothetical protein
MLELCLQEKHCSLYHRKRELLSTPISVRCGGAHLPPQHAGNLRIKASLRYIPKARSPGFRQINKSGNFVISHALVTSFSQGDREEITSSQMR